MASWTWSRENFGPAEILVSNTGPLTPRQDWARRPDYAFDSLTWVESLLLDICSSQGRGGEEEGGGGVHTIAN